MGCLQPAFLLQALHGKADFPEPGASFSTVQTASLSRFRVLSSDGKRCLSAGHSVELPVGGTRRLTQAVEAAL